MRRFDSVPMGERAERLAVRETGKMANTFIGDDGRRHAVARFSSALAGGRPAPVAGCGVYGRQGQTVVQYADGVCEGHEFGSEWPCLGCGK